MLQQAFTQALGYLRTKKRIPDSTIFSLNHYVTTALLVFFSILVTSKQYFGEPIHCAYNKELFSEAYVQSYCWVQASYYHPGGATVGFTDGARYGSDPVLAVEPHIEPGRGPKDHGAIFVHYYQWVPIVLFVQALMFYTPRFIWKKLEGGLMVKLSTKFGQILPSSDERQAERGFAAMLLTASDIAEDITIGHSGDSWYLAKYIFCEFLALVNLAVQWYGMDILFNNMFFTYGISMVKFLLDVSYTTPEVNPNPMTMIFPRVTKCTFHTFAFNGNLDVIESMCVLPLNVAIEKIYLFLWLWLSLLVILTSLLVLFRILLLICPCLRRRRIRSEFSHIKPQLVAPVISRISCNDWFILANLSETIGSQPISEILRFVATESELQSEEQPRPSNIRDSMISNPEKLI